jgi:hypothetical protein
LTAATAAVRNAARQAPSKFPKPWLLMLRLGADAIIALLGVEAIQQIVGEFIGGLLWFSFLIFERYGRVNEPAVIFVT